MRFISDGVSFVDFCAYVMYTFSVMENCTLCPRRCGADRNNTRGYCGADNTFRIGFIGAHFGEEPPVTGKKGSGAVFVSGCPLKCVYCQNADISANGNGREFTPSELERLFLELGEKCENINLVTAGHYLNVLIPVLEKVKPKLHVPVVYNSSGYETADAVRRLDGLVDVYLPDYKYYSDKLAEAYSSCPDYRETATAAIDEMVRQQPFAVFENSLIKKGVVIRHLVLPESRLDSIAVMRDIALRWKDKVLISLMSQYTPSFNRSQYKQLSRRITSFEYESVLSEAVRLGLNGFMQERTSATDALTPIFETR